MGFTAPEHPIYVPQTMEELTRPLYPDTATASEPLLQTLSAVLQMPVQEEPPCSYAGYLTEGMSSMNVHTLAGPDYYYGSTLDSQSGPYFCEPPNGDEDLVKDTQNLLNQLHGYSLY
jgi:hypothetical protein